MYKSTFQQIVLFIITSFAVVKTGKYLIALNDIGSLFDFGVIALFFVSVIFFMNYFVRLTSKLLHF